MINLELEDEIMNSPVELWKRHPYIDKIEVSTFGRVRSVNGHYYTSFPVTGGYMQIGFRVNGKRVHKYVHRLVAQTFIKNPDNLPEANHKDCDPTNNDVSNLEWCSHSYNIQYREKFGKALNRPVFAVNLTTLKVSRFRSQHEAGRALGVYQTNIAKVVKGKRNQTGGFWFVNDDGHAVDVVKSKLHDIGKTGLKVKCQSVN